ncbi:metal ABC transporter substrate-binding protein [Aerococcus viridans]|uniref:Metal ABC transporter substrate-binding protein n=1 Tax=Aerococcus viridans TaxID=1377 RepID=A0A2N6UDZ2_9LACT|nr:MetQ/NlpA family ABC transporter substrate-binding protein [Aerococcus viridans]PMC79788.1 metal ABC transporter substrate-binding protein [Aerococcus viridans]
MKKALWLITGATFFLAACGNGESAELDQISVASRGSDVEIWDYIAESDAATEAGLAIEVISIDGDGVQTNTATAEGEVDANAFQNLGYMETFNENSTNQLVPIATTYREPMGIYSDQYTAIDQVAEGDLVGISTNSASQARELSVLAGAGIITLVDDFDPNAGTINDIAENPLNLEFIEVDELQLARSLSDLNLAVIGNTIALESGLNVTKDAIYVEELDEHANGTINVIATAAGNEDDENLQKLSALYHSDEVQTFIAETFDGTKLEVEIPIEEVWSVD